jgi:RNA polymerase subunit RPABC4/transcription elongation factor Spt4
MCGHDHSPNITNHRWDNLNSPRHHARTVKDQQKTTIRPCPSCRIPVQEDFVFCPSCGTDLLKACPECHRAVEAQWPHCAFCGTELAAI